MKKELLKISSYATLKGLSRQAIYYQINKGNIKPDKIDGQLYININKYPIE